MNKFLVFAGVLVCASADIGLKLREGTPTGSYLPGVASNSYGNYAPQQLNYAPGGGYGQSSYNSYQASAPQQLNYGPEGGYGQSSYNSYQASAPGYSVQQNFAGIPQAIQHHRSFFFDATEDLGATHVRVHVQPSAASGDKSIFIKAPSYSSKIIPHFNIPQQQQAGRTKVVVLVKKPEEVQDIIIPSAAQGPASKPEVTFVTYKTQKEADEKIQDIQQGATGGSIAKTVFNHRELVANIKDEPSYGGSSVHSVIGAGPIIGNSGLGGGIISGPGHLELGSSGSSPVEHHHESTNYGPAGVSGPY